MGPLCSILQAVAATDRYSPQCWDKQKLFFCVWRKFFWKIRSVKIIYWRQNIGLANNLKIESLGIVFCFFRCPGNAHIFYFVQTMLKGGIQPKLSHPPHKLYCRFFHLLPRHIVWLILRNMQWGINLNMHYFSSHSNLI